jgi:membrane protease YdiL (CAAX protease family)
VTQLDPGLRAGGPRQDEPPGSVYAGATNPLDDEVRGVDRAVKRAYVRAALTALAVTVALEVGIVAVGRAGSTTTRAGLTVAAEAAMAVVAVMAARPLAGRRGWRAAVGLDGFRRGDVKTTAAWFGLQVATRLSVVYLLIICVPQLRHHRVSNLTGLAHASPVAVVLLAVAAVCIAPFAEELIMRGFVLRASMCVGMSFWPAAVLNGVNFGALHVHEGSTLLAGLVLGLSTGAFGVVQCLLVRRTGRLAPAIAVHATTNLLALAVALAAAHG